LKHLFFNESEEFEKEQHSKLSSANIDEPISYGLVAIKRGFFTRDFSYFF
jgi:hypothetical protein